MKLSEHDMLVTLATMALKMDDLTGHDVVEALRAHGHGGVVEEARKPEPKQWPLKVVGFRWEPSTKTRWRRMANRHGGSVCWQVFFVTQRRRTGVAGSGANCCS